MPVLARQPGDERLGLVDEWDVGARPRLVGHRAARLAQDQALLLRVEDAVGSAGQRRPARQDLTHDRGRADGRPDPVDRTARTAVVAQVFGELLTCREDVGSDALQALDQQPDQRGSERVTVELPRAAERKRVVHRGAERVGRQSHRTPTRRDDDVVRRSAEARSARVLHHVGQARVALHRGDRGGLDGPHRERRSAQPRHGRLDDRRLAERRQHLRDVAEEDGVRADHEHPRVGELLAVLVHEVRGAVEADRGLPRPWASLHDEADVETRAHDDVLLGLDRRDDVAHLAGAGPFELGEERVGDAPRHAAQHAVRVVEDLVEDVEQVMPLDAEPAAALQPERILHGRAVEGDRHRRAPVDDDGISLRSLDMASTHVERVETLFIDAAEAQREATDVELREPLAEVHRLRVRVDVAATGVVERLLEDHAGAALHRGEVVVGRDDVGLFGLEIRVDVRVGAHHRAAHRTRRRARWPTISPRAGSARRARRHCPRGRRRGSGAHRRR